MPLLRLARWVWRLGDPAGPVPVLALTAAVLLGIQLGRTIHDVDIFWQLKLGEIILRDGLPANEPFVAGQGDDRLAVVGWLGQATFAAVRSLGGWDGLRLFDAALWFGGFGLAGWSAARRARNEWFAAGGMWAGWLAAVTFASIRPQTFAVFCFGLLLVLMRSGLSARAKVALGSLLLLVWQNLHPSAAVGAGYLAAVTAAEWGMYLLGRGPRPNLAAVLLVPIAAAATLATPAGWDIYRISAENRDRCVWEELLITEWLPVWVLFPTIGRDQATPVLAAFLLAVLIRGRRVRGADLLPAVALWAVTLYTFRFVLFWGVAAAPVWAQAVAGGEDIPPRPTPRTRKVRRAVAAAGFLLALLPLRALPENFAGYFPFAGVEAMRGQHVRGTIHCNYFWGGVITDLGYPDWHPTHDGRYYLFSREQLSRHFAASRGVVPVEELEREFRPAAFFARPGNDDGLIANLRACPRWREVFADRNAVVFVPR